MKKTLKILTVSILATFILIIALKQVFISDPKAINKETIVIGINPTEKLVVDIYNREENNQNTAIVFTHGSVRNGRNEQFYPLMYNLLAKKGYTVVAYDLRGYGESLKYATINSPQELDFLSDAKRVLNYAKSLPGITEVITMGHSCGGDVSFSSGADDKDVRGMIKLSSAYHNYAREPKDGKLHYLDNKFNNVMATPLTYKDADRIVRDITVWYRIPLPEDKRVLIINVEHDHPIQLTRAKRFAQELNTDVKKVILKGVGHFFRKTTLFGDFYDHNKLDNMVNIVDEWIKKGNNIASAPINQYITYKDKENYCSTLG